MWLCIDYSGHLWLLIKWCLIHFLWFELNLKKRVLEIFKSSDFLCLFCEKFENLRANCFWNILEAFMCILFHKIWFSIDFLQNFQDFQIFKIFSLARSIEVDPRPIKNIQFLGQKSLSLLIPIQLLLNQPKIFKTFFSSLLDSSWPIEIWKFQVFKVW